MPNYFVLTLDTTGPSSPSISLEGGAAYATAQLITATIATGDGVTTGYQMKIWGDVDNAYDANIQTLEANSVWITYGTSKQIKLSASDASKTVYVKIRDDVNNESAQASDSIVLDTTLPVVTISGPDVNKISKIAGKNTASFSFSCDSNFVEYKVMYVASSSAANDAAGNALIGTLTATGSWTSASVINISITGTELETANAGDGSKTVKVFVRDSSNQWSV